MFKPDQHFIKVVGLFFCPYLAALSQGLALCLYGALRIVWRCKLKYTAVRLPRVFIALCGGKA